MANATINIRDNSTTNESSTGGLNIGILNVKSLFGFGGNSSEVPPEDRGIVEEFDEMCTLTRTQRLYGFGLTFVIGWVLNLISVFALPQIVLHPEKFALLYTVGNIVSLCSTAFLWGPMQQIKDMFKPIRMGATIIYLLSMVLTFYCAFKVRRTVESRRDESSRVESDKDDYDSTGGVILRQV